MISNKHAEIWYVEPEFYNQTLSPGAPRMEEQQKKDTIQGYIKTLLGSKYP